jgi:predicted MPP superfamily phosphohydrolase
VKPPRLSRRQFFATAALLTAGGALSVDATCVEPTDLAVRRLRIGDGPVTHRLAHFSDVHHKGDRAYLQTVVDTLNSLRPDFACFTGDIVERKQHLPAALEILSGIKCPVFGVPGNHDYWSRIPFAPVQECFAATGGAWLVNSSHEVPGQNLNFIGTICLFPGLPVPPSRPQCKNILLTHYPAHANRLGGRKFDLLLAGHSHGGQVRLPLIGSVILPGHVGEYDMGLFPTPAGPLYVNPGIGYISHYDVRFNCRPEITLIEI